MHILRRFSQLLGRWPIALGAVLVLAGLILVSGLDRPGLWEPAERKFADTAAPPPDIEAQREQAKQQEAERIAAAKLERAKQRAERGLPPEEEPACTTAAPPEAAARTLATRAAQWGRDLDDSDGGRRLPFALMGVLTALAAAGIAMRFAGARAGVITSLVLLAMPLLVLQSRMLTSDIGTACAATLIVYGLVAISRLGASQPIWLVIIDVAISVFALRTGVALGFYGGGALLGLIVPIGAFAAAGGLGVPVITSAIRRRSVLPHLPALLAAVATVILLWLLLDQIYGLEDALDPRAELRAQKVATRQLFGEALVIDPCWSSMLGGAMRPVDDLRITFDSTFEQIAYGTFPWGMLAPIAIAGLLRSDDLDQRRAGAIALAWAAAAWIATEVFQRKVGFTVYAGFPALAIAVGVWLDGVLNRRARGDGGLAAGTSMLIAMMFGLAALNFGKDMQSFADRLPSLLVGTDQIAYPKDAEILGVPAKLWVLLLGMMTALGAAVSLGIWRDKPIHQRIAAWAIAVAFAASGVMGAFWAFAWQPGLSLHLSSKAMFETYRELRKPGDQLVIMGELGLAARSYADVTPEVVNTRGEVVASLGRPNRVFAIAPQTELCTLHREIGGKPYFVIDDRNTRSLLLSNRLDGTTDKNPLATAILHSEPTDIPERAKGRIVFDGRLQLLGWDVPKRMSRGSRVQVRMFYKVLQPVGGAWKVFMHFDGPIRFHGDHEPIRGRCQTSTWQPGDYIVDTHTIVAGGPAFPRGPYALWTGFFTGSNPNWKNMTVSEAPGDLRDTADRVKLTTVMID
ncbi:MAG: ArnT family glycosyltransferase [Kofleriaceae bacterium]